MDSNSLEELVERLTIIYVTAQVNQKPMGAGDFANLYMNSKKFIRDRLLDGKQ